MWLHKTSDSGLFRHWYSLGSTTVTCRSLDCVSLPFRLRTILSVLLIPHTTILKASDTDTLHFTTWTCSHTRICTSTVYWRPILYNLYYYTRSQCCTLQYTLSSTPLYIYALCSLFCQVYRKKMLCMLISCLVTRLNSNWTYSANCFTLQDPRSPYTPLPWQGGPELVGALITSVSCKFIATKSYVT